MTSLEKLEGESIFGPYTEQLIESWGENKVKNFLEKFTDDCRGCGGCCMNFCLNCGDLWGRTTQEPCYSPKEKSEGGQIIRYECSDYENRPDICRDYEQIKTKDRLVCHPFLKETSEEDVPKILEVLYLPSHLDIKKRVLKIRKIEENNKSDKLISIDYGTAKRRV